MVGATGVVGWGPWEAVIEEGVNDLRSLAATRRCEAKGGREGDEGQKEEKMANRLRRRDGAVDVGANEMSRNKPTQAQT